MPDTGPDPLARFYDPPPLNRDPAVLVPDLPRDVPLFGLSPADAPSQSRPDDWDERGRPRLRYFTRAEYDILTKLTETLIVPPGDNFAIPPKQAAMNVDRYLATMHTPMRLQIRIALHLLNLWTMTSLRLPFRWMSLRARRAWARRFERNRGMVVTKLLKLKNLVYLNYYGDPGTDVVTGYNLIYDRDPSSKDLRRFVRSRLRNAAGGWRVE
ncbi:MAG: hypothetical protein AB7S36_08835 [Planctomycetota bacterium]